MDLASDVIAAFIKEDKKRVTSGEISSQTIPNHIKPIKVLLDANRVPIHWKSLHKLLPRREAKSKDRAYTKEEIQKMLEVTNDITDKVIILLFSSGGFRLESWDYFTWKDVIFFKNEDGTHKGASLLIYRGDPESYFTFITPEACKALEIYRESWKKDIGVYPKPDDPLIKTVASPMIRRLAQKGVRKRIDKIVSDIGLRLQLPPGVRRHEVQLDHGFQKYFNTVGFLQIKGPGTFLPRDSILREEKEVLVETILADSIKKFNKEVNDVPDRTDEIIYKLNSIIFSVREIGLIKANEEFSKWIKNEQSMPYGPDGQHIPITLIDFENIENNNFIVTTQYSFKSKVTKRPDLVLLVNGIPLVVIEAKNPVRSAISWANGTLQVSEDYEKNIPEIFVPNVFSAATEGKELQYGAIGSSVEEFWSPWRKEDPDKQGLMAISDTIKSLFNKKTVLEMLQHYCFCK